ncbi:MAG: Ribosome-associated heat shock protein implicated in the recycling of the 50S subunit (S4 paralog) [uncultured Thiotrichaceae bacterium]|uniref:Heat shock protein 15 n=1 Tax=uncultured Thiotrichaceae bacterium TaxID=298394 RepID=A0A6S6SFA0_9GAMM|nr:MAG: Ribosome-associated heat shock protein implicated in the recycling of the 50S subunit (S4 paralog) [uncultured Thiotrichaceae bacterium]
MAIDRGQLERVRLDKWLWAARFFKTRALASDAVAGGKVHVNAERCKSSRKVGAGDKVLVTRGVESFDVLVLGVNDKRRPAKEAVLLYEETEQSVAKRKLDAEMRKYASHEIGGGRKPDKHQRRELRRIKGRT